METLLARALELGAEKAKAIDTGSVAVEEWVIWKCPVSYTHLTLPTNREV